MCTGSLRALPRCCCDLLGGCDLGARPSAACAVVVSVNWPQYPIYVLLRHRMPHEDAVVDAWRSTLHAFIETLRQSYSSAGRGHGPRFLLVCGPMRFSREFAPFCDTIRAVAEEQDSPRVSFIDVRVPGTEYMRGCAEHPSYKENERIMDAVFDDVRRLLLTDWERL